MKTLLAFSSIFGISASMLSQNLNTSQKNSQIKNEITYTIDYEWEKRNYEGSGKDVSYDYVFFNWLDYESSWGVFKQVYSQFKVIGEVYVAVKGVGDYKFRLENATFNTNSILEAKDKSKSLKISVPYFQRHGDEHAVFVLNIWKERWKIFFDWEFFYRSNSYGILRTEIESATFYRV